MAPVEEELKLLQEEVRKLRQAVEHSPDDDDLRLRLIARLLEADQPQGAWHNCLHLLQKDPNNIRALRLAKKAAETVGARYRAEEYVRRLAELLSTSTRQGPEGALWRVIRGGREDTGKIRLSPERRRKLS